MLITSPIIAEAVAVIGGYPMGSVPFGLIATRLAGLGDVAQHRLAQHRRDQRAAHRPARPGAVLALLADGGKGAVAVLLMQWLSGLGRGGRNLAGGAAFLGHCFPVWLKFKGGKGVATSAGFGTMIAIAWPAGLAAGATWIVMAYIFRFSSLAGLTAAVSAPIYVFLFTQTPEAKLWMAVFMALLIFIRHHENIRRLLKGEEPRIGSRPPEAAATAATDIGHNGGPPLA